MKEEKKNLFPTAQGAVKKGTAAMLCMVLVGLLTVSCKTEVTDVRLNKTELTLSIGETETLTATVLPEDADNKAVTWQSSDNEVAAVDNNGKVTAKEAGSALITVITKDGGKTAICTVNVLCNCLFDTLKGEWSWFKTYVGNGFFKDSDCKSILKILNQGKDGTINYEVVIKDSLSYTGNFLYYYDEWNVRRIDRLKLLCLWHPDVNWFGFMTGGWQIHINTTNKDILRFKIYDSEYDGSSYHYQRIK